MCVCARFGARPRVCGYLLHAISTSSDGRRKKKRPRARVQRRWASHSVKVEARKEGDGTWPRRITTESTRPDNRWVYSRNPRSPTPSCRGYILREMLFSCSQLASRSQPKNPLAVVVISSPTCTTFFVLFSYCQPMEDFVDNYTGRRTFHFEAGSFTLTFVSRLVRTTQSEVEAA